MKILAFTDLHLSRSAYRRIKLKTRFYRPDLLVCAGDISIFEEGLDEILERLNRLGKKLVIIHGNHESETNMKKLCKQYKNIEFLHKSHAVHDQCLFLGYGGGGFALVEPEFNTTGKKFSKLIKKNKDKKVIFITHAPPYGTKVDLVLDQHCGNKTFTDFIKKNKINYHICGHLHENFGKTDIINGTTIMNPGPYGKLIRI